MKVLINPGSGPVQNGSKEQSEVNIKQFISDLKVDCGYEFLRIEECGRHTYRIWNETQSHEIQMPPLPLEFTRYMGGGMQAIFDFPRLYVDGGSWVWAFALDMCFKNNNKQ